MKTPHPLLALPRVRMLAALIGACLSSASLHAVVTLNPSGTTDRTSDINTAINNARAAGDYVMLNAGTYHHSGEITISGAVEVRGAGDTTILLSTQPLSATVRLTGTGPKLRNIQVKSNYAGPIIANSPDRSQAALSCLVFIKDAISFLVENVTTDTGRGAGIMVMGSRGTSSSAKAKILNCRARNTLADGMHLTSGTKWVQVENCNNTNTGDDLIAVVSKLKKNDGTDDIICTDIAILNNTVGGNLWGRGITVVGGTNIVIRGNTITNANGSGVLLASDSYDTFQVSGIEVKNNTITNPNAGVRSGQNGITIEGRLKAETGVIYKVSGANLINNTITNANGRGVVIGRYTENITLTDMKIDGTSAAGVEITSPDTDSATFPKNITITGVDTSTSYIRNTGAQGVSAGKATGTLKVENTGFQQINKTGPATANDVIRVADCTGLTANIINNHYSNPSSNGVHRYVECSEPAYTPKPVTNNNGNTVAAGITTGSYWAP